MLVSLKSLAIVRDFSQNTTIAPGVGFPSPFGLYFVFFVDVFVLVALVEEEEEEEE